jgi:thymidylate synthase
MSDRKTCKCCNKTKEVSEFTKDSSTFDGIRTKCKACQQKVNRKYSQSNKEQLKQKAKERRLRDKYGCTWDDWKKVENGDLKICYSCNMALPLDYFTYSGERVKLTEKCKTCR